jgi:hypothetical protein
MCKQFPLIPWLLYILVASVVSSCGEADDLRPSETAQLASKTWLVKRIEGTSFERSDATGCQQVTVGALAYTFNQSLGGDRLRGRMTYDGGRQYENDSTGLKAFRLCFKPDQSIRIDHVYDRQGQVFWCDTGIYSNGSWSWLNLSRPVIRSETLYQLFGHVLAGQPPYVISFLDPVIYQSQDDAERELFRLFDFEVLTLTADRLVLGLQVLIESPNGDCPAAYRERRFEIECERYDCPDGNC